MALNLTHLATLREFARRGSLTAAAEALGYTLGAVSQQMRALERAADAPLFRKVGRQLVLTESGRVLAEHAELLLHAEARALCAIAPAGAELTGTVVIGTWGTTAGEFLAPVANDVRERHPRLCLQSREVDVDAAAKAVRYGEVDIAFGVEYPVAPIARDPTIAVLRLRRERFALAVHAGHRLAERAQVSMRELATEQWILPTERSAYGLAFRAVCRGHDFEPLVAHEVTDTAATMSLVGHGVGIAPVTDLMQRLNAPARIRRVRLQESVTRSLVLVAPTDVAARPSLQTVVEVISAVIAQRDS